VESYVVKLRGALRCDVAWSPTLWRCVES